MRTEGASHQNGNGHYRSNIQDEQYAAMRGPGNRNYSQRGGTDFLSSLNGAIRDNPVAAALIGMGALWMFMGGNDVSLVGGRGRRSVVRVAARHSRNLSHAAADTASSVSEAVSSAASSVRDTVSDASERVGEYASAMTHRSRPQDDGYGYARERDYYATGHDGMRDDWDDSRHSRYMPDRQTMSRMQENFQDMFERHPIALGVAGLAVGAAVAASLPLTEKERETLGSASDSVQRTVKETVTDTMSKAKEMASAAVDEVSRSTGSKTGEGV